jgi:hypothetical protein
MAKRSLATRMICSSSDMSDNLETLKGASYCPNCGSLANVGNSRCPECGTFHSTAHLVEREPPLPSIQVEEKPLEPSSYSLNPNLAGPEEEFESDENSVVEWTGGSTDFTFQEEE